jgi:hypothetical protein
VIQIQSSTLNKPQTQMFTIPQLAAQGILPERAIRRLVAERKVPTIKVGNRQYINLTVFERYLSGTIEQEAVTYGEVLNGTEKLV